MLSGTRENISFKGGVWLPLLFEWGFQSSDLSWVTEAHFIVGVSRGDLQLWAWGGEKTKTECYTRRLHNSKFKKKVWNQEVKLKWRDLRKDEVEWAGSESEARGHGEEEGAIEGPRNLGTEQNIFKSLKSKACSPWLYIEYWPCYMISDQRWEKGDGTGIPVI